MEALTPDDRSASDLTELRNAWVNEKTCPEILMHNDLLVQRLMNRVQEQEQQIAQIKEEPVLQSVCWMDLNRAKFLLRAYLRTRLIKIETHVLHVCSNDDILANLTEVEVNYAKQYALLIDEHYKEDVLNNLPYPYNSLIEQIDSGESGEEKQFDMVAAPNVNTHVFCRVVEDIGNIEIDRDTMDLQKDELLVIRYKLIRRLLMDGHVTLM